MRNRFVIFWSWWVIWGEAGKGEWAEFDEGSFLNASGWFCS